MKGMVRLSAIYKNRSEIIHCSVGILIGFVLAYILFLQNDPTQRTSHQTCFGDCRGIAVPMDAFPEPAWRTPATLGARVVTSTPFARFEIHKVRTESGVIVNDWLWVDERSHVNILVHLKEENKFLLFHQKKYGLDKGYYALIGGLFNEGETGVECARRELLEETGLEAGELIDLGRYRVQVNRGGGILYAYYAKNCVKSKLRKASDDYEKQEMRKLTRKELVEVAKKGEIGEAQWAAAVGLGLLHDGV